MSRSTRRLFGALAAAILAVNVAWCSGEEARKKIDPSPPVLKPVRWQTLAPRFRDVFIDGHGRAWFLVRTFPMSLSKATRPNMYLTCPAAPDKYVEIPGAHELIGFDSKSRFWEVGEYELCYTDVKSGKFVQVRRKPAHGMDLSPWKRRWGGGWRPKFLPSMFEHSTGRHYFPDTLGVHVLDGRTWSYKLFGKPQCLLNKMVEGPDGKVFFLYSRDETTSVFVHDGVSWKKFSPQNCPELARIRRPSDIAPEPGGWVRLSGFYDYSIRVKLYDGKPAAIKTAARSVARYDTEFLARAGEELSLYGAALGRDKDGRVYFACGEKVAVMDVRYPAKGPALKYEAFRFDRHSWRALAVDSRGGIWARLAVDEHPFLSRYFDGKWTHYPDPAAVRAEKINGSLVQWGSTWVMRPSSAGPGWRPNWQENLRHVPSMANPGLLQALKNEGMIAAATFAQRAFLFDGERWHTFGSLKALVEARYDWLRKNLDNRGMSWQAGTCLGLDATGRIWVFQAGAHDLSEAYDGRQWQKSPKGRFKFNAAGSRCLAGGYLWNTSVWPPKELAAAKARNRLVRSETWERFRIEAKDKLVPTDPFSPGARSPDTYDKHGYLCGVSEPGPVIWICFRIHGKPFTCLQAIWPDGAKSRPYRHPVSLDYHVVHQAGNVYWAAAADGMLRLRLAGTGAHSRIVLDKRYPRVIAQGRIRWMGIGPDGGLWMATVGGRSGLYRMDIPPVAAGEKAEVAYHPPSKSKPLHKGPPRKTVTKVRVATRNWFGYAYVKNGDLTRAGKLADQTVKFEFSDPKRPDRLQLADLMAGKYDLAVVRLPSQGGEDVNKLIRSLRDKKYSVTPIGWHVLGITVHPGCPLDAIDADTLRKVLRGRIQSWRDLTGKNEKINLVHNIEIQDILTAIASCTPAGHVERHFAIPKTLKELAADPTKMGMMAVEERLVSSGLKILPVRTAAGKPAVAPSVQNVKDGKYPFYACVAVIVRPDAPQAAKDFADVLRSPRFTSTFCGAWLTGLHYALPAAAKPQVFPANGADPPASMTGAVAVLPTENHSPHFLMARPEHLVGWDQAVADAVAGNKRLAIVDRAELKKVLRELKLAMATGSRRRGPMLSADVLVTSNMVTRNARAWLVIQAFHVRTGTCLGEVRLPVDPVHPERFTPALPDVLKKWWPGVLAGLQAARTRPILAVTVASVGKTVDQAVGPLRTELEATLAKDERVFVAQRRMMPEARRETLMRLMGLARSTGHGLPPAADFLVDVVKSGEEFRIRVMNGRSMKVLASTAMSAARASDWLRERVGALKKPAPPDDTGARPAGDAAKRQAKAELARGLKLEAKYKKLWAVGTTRGSGNSASEHRKQLAALRATMLQCFERAAQLDPTDELACRKVADIYWSRTNGAYDGMKKALARCTQHVDSFPRSRHIRGMMERVISLHGNLARYLETHPVRDASLTGVPRTLPEKKLIKEYHRGALKCLARYVKRFIAVRDKRDRSSWLSFGAVAKYYGLQMGRYFQLDISEQEMEEVVAEYGRAVGSRFDVMVPPEYRKLQYYTVKADKKSYVEQVAMMQKRWPDPNGTYWKLAKDGVLRGLCELYKTDARATHFYRWLRGWGKPGNLP